MTGRVGVGVMVVPRWKVGWGPPEQGSGQRESASVRRIARVVRAARLQEPRSGERACNQALRLRTAGVLAAATRVTARPTCEVSDEEKRRAAFVATLRMRASRPRWNAVATVPHHCNQKSTGGSGGGSIGAGSGA